MRILRKIKENKTVDTIKDRFFVFDVETTKLEPLSKNFVFGVIYGYNFYKVIKDVESFRNEFKKRKYNGKIIFAHNAEFDLLTIFGNIYTEIDSKALFNGKFISCKLGLITFADSMNIFPTSVEKIGEKLGIKKYKNTKIATEKLTKKNITQKDINYCIRDCEIVYNALLQIFKETGSIKITIASLSMYHFRKNFLKLNLTFSDLVDKFYLSYYGGRTEAFKIGNCNGKVYDINSLYPFAMITTKFPDIKTLKYYTKIDLKYFHYMLFNYEGLAKVVLFHEKTYFGFIPYKDEKLLFPVGKFETIINFNELRFAVKNNIVKILSVEYAVCSLSQKTIFQDFVKYHYDKKANAKDELTREIHKLFLTNLYGRFAMRMKYTTEYFNYIPYEIVKELIQLDKYYMLKLFSELRNDCYLVTENNKFKNSFYSIPTFSSYITSRARIILLTSLIKNENNKVLYCDTDSIFLEGNFEGKVNENIGNFKLENKQVIEINGLKNYKYIDEEKKLHEVIKGISKNAVKLGENEYLITKYYKSKESLRRNKEAGESFEMKKELKHKYDKRNVFLNGETEPIYIQ